MSALTTAPGRKGRRDDGPLPERRWLGTDKRQNLTGWAFLLPASLLIVLVSFVPMIQALILSLQTGRGRNLEFAKRSS